MSEMPPINGVQMLLAAVSIMLCNSACAESGKVVDRQSGKPIPNAIVVARWNGVVRTFAEPHSTCYKAELGKSDDQGRFSVSSLSGNVNPFLMDRQRVVLALAPGYRLWPQRDPDSLEIQMEAQTGSNSEKIKSLPPAFTCDGADKVLLPYLKALYQETSNLATTNEEKLKALSILLLIETTELGDHEALNRFAERRALIGAGSQ
jgi:hypothetical protein